MPRISTGLNRDDPQPADSLNRTKVIVLGYDGYLVRKCRCGYPDVIDVQPATGLGEMHA